MRRVLAEYDCEMVRAVMSTPLGNGWLALEREQGGGYLDTASGERQDEHPHAEAVAKNRARAAARADAVLADRAHVLGAYLSDLEAIGAAPTLRREREEAVLRLPR